MVVGQDGAGNNLEVGDNAEPSLSNLSGPTAESLAKGAATTNTKKADLATVLTELEHSDPKYELIAQAMKPEGITVKFRDGILKESTAITRRFEAGEVIAAKAVSDEINSKIRQDSAAAESRSSLGKYISVKNLNTSDIVELAAQTGLNVPQAHEILHMALSRSLLIQDVFNRVRRKIATISASFEEGQIPAVDEIRNLPSRIIDQAIEMVGEALGDKVHTSVRTDSLDTESDDTDAETDEKEN